MPILFELYLFSVDSIDETAMNKEESAFKKEILLDPIRLKEKKTKAYIDFVQGLQKSITPPAV